ncbi:hypothetical protein LCGC14_2404740, partial [marine sediment metagenome]
MKRTKAKRKDFGVTWFDRFLSHVAPTWAKNRVRSRASLD